MRLHWNGCGLLLHEICHLIHQFVLEDGLFNETVKDVYSKARESGLYEKVLRRDWAGYDEDYDMGENDGLSCRCSPVKYLPAPMCLTMFCLPSLRHAESQGKHAA